MSLDVGFSEKSFTLNILFFHFDDGFIVLFGSIDLVIKELLVLVAILPIESLHFLDAFERDFLPVIDELLISLLVVSVGLYVFSQLGICLSLDGVTQFFLLLACGSLTLASLCIGFFLSLLTSLALFLGLLMRAGATSSTTIAFLDFLDFLALYICAISIFYGISLFVESSQILFGLGKICLVLAAKRCRSHIHGFTLSSRDMHLGLSFLGIFLYYLLLLLSLNLKIGTLLSNFLQLILRSLHLI